MALWGNRVLNVVEHRVGGCRRVRGKAIMVNRQVLLRNIDHGISYDCILRAVRATNEF